MPALDAASQAALPGVLCFLVVALGGCHLCEYREYASTLVQPVGLDEPCPVLAEGPREGAGNSGLVSIDGPPTRAVDEPARQTCCYDGVFLLDGAEVAGEICGRFVLEGRGDEGAVQPCPAAQEARDVALATYSFSRGSKSFQLSREDILSVDSAPRPGAVTLRKESCRYPTTERTTQDVCG